MRYALTLGVKVASPYPKLFVTKKKSGQTIIFGFSLIIAHKILGASKNSTPLFESNKGAKLT